MSNIERGFGQLSDDELMAKMRGNSVNALPYQELSAELARRVARRQMLASTAQVWSAWLQFVVVVLMAMTLAVTLVMR